MAIAITDPALAVIARERDDARLAVLDALRGLAALAVALFHFYSVHGSNVGEDWLARAVSWGWLGVPVFFVISGYVIPRSALGDRASAGTAAAGRFLARRWLRVGIPLLAAAALSWLTWWGSAAWWPGFAGEPPPAVTASITACHLLSSCALMHESWLNPVFWTLGLEFQFYLLTALVIALRGRVRMIVALPAFVAALLLAPVVDAALVFAWLPLFAMGWWVWLAQRDERPAWQLHLGVALLALATYLELGLAQTVAGYAAALVALHRVRAPRVLLWLGAVSYSLYLVHVPVGRRVINLLRPACGEQCGPLAVATLAALALAVSLLAAWLFWRWVEQPALALAQRVRRR